MTFAYLTSDKEQHGAVALVMTTGKHGLIPKSAPIHSTTAALHRAVHTQYLCQSFVNSQAYNLTTCDTGHPTGYWGYLHRLQIVIYG